MGIGENLGVGKAAIEGLPGMPVLQAPDDVTGLIAICFEHHVRALILHSENLTGQFFDLSSGEAGAILQKLRNYGIRLAVVTPPGAVQMSTMFPQMLVEESRSGFFQVFEDIGPARTWLANSQE